MTAVPASGGEVFEYRYVDSQNPGVLLGLALFAWPAALGADPIVITSGLVETNVGIAAARVTLEGEGFELRTAASFGSPLAPLCSPCAGGTPVALNGTYTQGLPLPCLSSFRDSCARFRIRTTCSRCFRGSWSDPARRRQASFE
jgi:hypothetical protein